MSLTTITNDVNCVGTYPDVYLSFLNIREVSGKVDRTSLTSTYKYRHSNKYYGEIIRTYNNISSSSNMFCRLLFLNDVPEAKVFCNGKLILFFRDMRFVIEKDKKRNWYLHHETRRYHLSTRNNIVSGELAVMLLREASRYKDVETLVTSLREHVQDG